jgi:hypothetical protein
MGRARAQAVKDLQVLQRECTERGFGKGYWDRDRHGRSACEVLQACCDRGASFDRGLLTPLNEAEWAVPEGLHSAEFKRFLEFLFANNKKYAEKRQGVGARLLRLDPKKFAKRLEKARNEGKPKPKEPARSSIQFQLSSNKDLDGGAFDFLRSWVEAATERVRSRNSSADDVEYGAIGSRFLRWWEDRRVAFENINILITQLHFVFYFPGGSLSLHRDARLHEECSRRAIFPAPPPPPAPGSKKRKRRATTRPRLTFYVSQPKPPKTRGAPTFYDGQFNNNGALCLGKVDGAILMTGKGAGGVELIPAGHVDMSGDWAKIPREEWPAVFIYHEPWNKKAPFKGAPAGAASYVFSGFERS